MCKNLNKLKCQQGQIYRPYYPLLAKEGMKERLSFVFWIWLGFRV